MYSHRSVASSRVSSKPTVVGRSMPSFVPPHFQFRTNQLQKISEEPLELTGVNTAGKLDGQDGISICSAPGASMHTKGSVQVERSDILAPPKVDRMAGSWANNDVTTKASNHSSLDAMNSLLTTIRNQNGHVNSGEPCEAEHLICSEPVTIGPSYPHRQAPPMIHHAEFSSTDKQLTKELHRSSNEAFRLDPDITKMDLDMEEMTDFLLKDLFPEDEKMQDTPPYSVSDGSGLSILPPKNAPTPWCDMYLVKRKNSYNNRGGSSPARTGAPLYASQPGGINKNYEDRTATGRNTACSPMKAGDDKMDRLPHVSP